MATTTRLAIPYPALAGTDIDDVPNWMNQMAVRLDAIIAPMSHGTLAARPVSSGGSPGIADRLYYATDVDPDTLPDRANVNGQFYRDNGVGWDPIGPFATKVGMGAFYAPVVTGNQAIVGLGFKPKIVKFSYAAVTLAFNNSEQIGLGGMTAAFQYSQLARGNASGDVVYIFNEATVIHMDAPSTGVTSHAASRTSLDADGFTINWSIVGTSNTLRVVWEAWG
jgi:hypothetical protein